MMLRLSDDPLECLCMDGDFLGPRDGRMVAMFH